MPVAGTDDLSEQAVGTASWYRDTERASNPGTDRDEATLIASPRGVLLPSGRSRKRRAIAQEAQRQMSPESALEASPAAPERQSLDATSRPLAQFLTYRIARLHQALNAQAVSILSEVSGISLGQWRIMVMIGWGGVTTARELTRRTGFDPAFISRTVRSLEDAGLLRTERSRADRRVLNMELTAEGAELHDRTLPYMQARQDALLGALAPEERDAIFGIIDKLELGARRRGVAA